MKTGFRSISFFYAEGISQADVFTHQFGAAREPRAVSQSVMLVVGDIEVTIMVLRTYINKKSLNRRSLCRIAFRENCKLMSLWRVD